MLPPLCTTSKTDLVSVEEVSVEEVSVEEVSGDLVRADLRTWQLTAKIITK